MAARSSCTPSPAREPRSPSPSLGRRNDPGRRKGYAAPRADSWRSSCGPATWSRCRGRCRRARRRWCGALLAALGHKGEVPSPSFAIVQPYEDLSPPVWHVDLYRIEQPSDLDELGLEDIRDDGVLIIEWPEHAGRDVWPDALALSLEARDDGSRSLTAQVPSAWEGRWPPSMIPPTGASDFLARHGWAEARNPAACRRRQFSPLFPHPRRRARARC